MLRTGWLKSAPLLAMLFVAAPVVAQDSPLAQVPAGAPLVVQVHGIERTKDRLAAMIQNGLPDLGMIAKAKLGEAFMQGTQGRDLKGLAKDGPVFLFSMSLPGQGAQPEGAAVVKVTSYQEFRDSFLKEDERKSLKKDPGGFDSITIGEPVNQELFLVERKGYVVLTHQKELAAQFTKSQPGLDTRLSKEMAKRLLDADVALYVNLATVNQQYGPQIQLFKQLMEVALQQQGAQLGDVDMYKKMFGAIFQGIQDSTALLFATDFRPEGFALHGQIQVGDKTATNAILKGIKPGPLTEIDKLPGSMAMFSGFQLDQALLKTFQTFLYGVQGSGEKQAKTVLEALDAMVAAKPQYRIDAVKFPLEGVQIWKYEKPAEAVAAQLKMLQSLSSGGAYQQAVLKGKPEIKPDAEKYRGFSMNYVSMKWDLEKMLAVPNIPENLKAQMTEGIKGIMGEGMKLWFGGNDQLVVQVFAKDWDSGKALLDSYFDGKATAGQNAAFQASRKQMPAEATFLGLMDTVDYTTQMFKFMETIVQGQVNIPPGIPNLGAVKSKTSYLGMAATLHDGYGSFDFWLPGTAMNTLYKMFAEPLMKQ